MKTQNHKSYQARHAHRQGRWAHAKLAKCAWMFLLTFAGNGLCATTWAAPPKDNKPATTRPAPGRQPAKPQRQPANRATATAPATSRLTFEVQRKSGDITVRFGPGKQIQLRLDGSISTAKWHQSGQRMRLLSASGAFLSGDVDLTLPRGSNVEVQTFNGVIKIGPGAHDVFAKTLAGDIHVQGVTGRTRLRTINGLIKLSDARGGVRASSISGDITLSHTKGPMKATTVSGSVTLTHCDLDTIFAQAISGDINISHCQLKHGMFKAFSGTIRLSGPFGVSASLVATTSSGDVTVLWPQTQPVSATGTTQSGDNKIPPSVQQRTGTPKLELRTTSGDILWRWSPKTPPKKP